MFIYLELKLTVYREQSTKPTKYMRVHAKKGITVIFLENYNRMDAGVNKSE